MLSLQSAPLAWRFRPQSHALGVLFCLNQTAQSSFLCLKSLTLWQEKTSKVVVKVVHTVVRCDSRRQALRAHRKPFTGA